MVREHLYPALEPPAHPTLLRGGGSQRACGHSPRKERSRPHPTPRRPGRGGQGTRPRTTRRQASDGSVCSACFEGTAGLFTWRAGNTERGPAGQTCHGWWRSSWHGEGRRYPAQTPERPTGRPPRREVGVGCADPSLRTGSQRYPTASQKRALPREDGARVPGGGRGSKAGTARAPAAGVRPPTNAG